MAQLQLGKAGKPPTTLLKQAERIFTLPGSVYNAMPGRIRFGAGASRAVGEELDRLGTKRAIVVSTPGRSGIAERVAADLDGRCAAIYPHAVSQVPIELAQKANRDIRDHDYDCIVSVGGGAAIGLGKAIALESGLPIVAIPTTYSGSEMTGFCGITVDGVKRMHTSMNMLASSVIYDPELTLTLPVSVSAQSTMNAIAHCIEAIYVPTASPVIARAAVDAIGILAHSVPRITQSPEDLEARTDILFGAYIAGAALTCGFALQHGLAHVFGGTYNIPHGISHSLALPYVTAFNEQNVATELQPVAEIFGTRTAAEGLWKFAIEIGAPVCLADHAFTEADVDHCTDVVVETDNGLNPREVEHQGVRSVIKAALSGQCPA